MNREILFRGKEVSSKKWVYGFYVHVPLGRFGKDEHIIQTIGENGRMSTLYDVNSSTVGQFTGVLDQNDNKIFEGDILFDGVQKYEVRYSKTACAFDAFGTEKDGIWSLYHLAHEGNMHRKIEIVGNVHENSKPGNRDEQTY